VSSPASASSPGPRRLPRLGTTVLLLALGTLAVACPACDEAKHPPGSHSSSASSPAPATRARLEDWLTQANPVPRISEGTRAELVRHATSSKPWPRKPSARQRLALFGHRLAYLDADGMKVRALAAPRTPGLSAAESLSIPLDRLSRVVPLFDGGALFGDSRLTVYLPIDKPALQPLPHLPLLGDVQLLTDPRDANAFSLLHPSLGTVGHFRVDQPSKSGILLPLVEAHLEPKNLTACAVLKDGSLVCVGQSSVFAGSPGLPMRPRGALSASQDIFRICAGTRQTDFLVIDGAGWIRTHSLEEPARVLHERSLGAAPLDLVEARGRLAYLSLLRPEGAQQMLRLTVTDHEGKELFATELSPGSGTNLGDVELDVALHPQRPWVGVRTRSSVAVFDHALGTQLFSAEIAPRE